MKLLNKLLLTLGLVGTISVLPSCKSVDTTGVTIILPNGTPTLALGTLINEVEEEVVTDPTLLQTALITKQTDLVIAPLTAGTNLFLKGKSKYMVEAIITTNNAYLVSRGNNELTPENLQGKSIVGFQETNTPGIMLKSYLEKENINAKTQFEANVNASVNAFKTGLCEYAVVAEPQLTSLETQYTDLNILNLGDELCEGKNDFVPQAAIFVNPDSKDDEDVKAFLKKLEKNINTLNTKPEKYAEELISSEIPFFSTYKVETLKVALPRCNLAYKKASENKESIENFYDNCDKYVNNMFQGVKPSEEFYN